jgi:hypothetical protein
MIHYNYNRQISPPAPFIHVTLRCTETGKELRDLPAQLDSAADRSAIPSHLVEELGLVPLDELPVSGFGGQVMLLPTYLVQFNLRQKPSLTIEVLAHSAEPFVLLGRDVMNQYRIVLDGPRLALDIE